MFYIYHWANIDLRLFSQARKYKFTAKRAAPQLPSSIAVTLNVLTLALLTQRVPFCFPVSPIDTAF